MKAGEFDGLTPVPISCANSSCDIHFSTYKLMKHLCFDALSILQTTSVTFSSNSYLSLVFAVPNRRSLLQNSKSSLLCQLLSRRCAPKEITNAAKTIYPTNSNATVLSTIAILLPCSNFHIHSSPLVIIRWASFPLS